MIKIVLETGQKLWFTSDTHYSHKNICRGTTTWLNPPRVRDFDTLDQMNAAIVNNINSCVGQDDILFHLGDWSFGGFEKIAEFRYRVVCQNIHLILGNHDHHIEKDREGVSALFSSVSQYAMIEVSYANADKFYAVLMHYPIASWHDMGKNVYHLHGHVHLPPHQKVAMGRAMDVGLDGITEFRPYEIREVDRILRGRPVKALSLPSDHHEITENYKK